MPTPPTPDTQPYAKRLAHYKPIITAAALRHGIPPHWLLAIARQESSMRSNVAVLTGGDGLRGGAYGLCQVTLKTAKGLGFVGPVELLLKPEVNADLAAKLVAQLHKRYTQLADVAAAYNSGKPYAKAPQVTRERYVPAVLEFAEGFATGPQTGSRGQS